MGWSATSPAGILPFAEDEGGYRPCFSIAGAWEGVAFRIEFGSLWNLRRDLHSQKRVTDQRLLRMVGGLSTKGHWNEQGSGT